MLASLVQDIKKKIDDKATEDLLDIWIENNREKWSAEYFEAVRLILLERNETPPSQKKSREEPEWVRADKKRKSLAKSLLLSGVGIYILISLINYMFIDLFWPTSPIMEILRQIRNALTSLCIFIAILLFIWPWLLKKR